MQITPAVLRSHGLNKHSARCTIRWLTRHGLSWRTFFKEGYPLAVIVEACNGREDPDVADLLDWLTDQGLYTE